MDSVWLRMTQCFKHLEYGATAQKPNRKHLLCRIKDHVKNKPRLRLSQVAKMFDPLWIDENRRSFADDGTLSISEPRQPVSRAEPFGHQMAPFGVAIGLMKGRQWKDGVSGPTRNHPLNYAVSFWFSCYWLLPSHQSTPARCIPLKISPSNVASQRVKGLGLW